MDTVDHRRYDRGGGRRGRGTNRGRNRYRNPRGYHNSYHHYNNDHYYHQDSSQKDESYNYESNNYNHRSRGRGYRRGRGGYRGGPRTARGRGRHNQYYEDEQYHEESKKTQEIEKEEEDEFGFNPMKNYGYGSKAPPRKYENKPKSDRPKTAAPKKTDPELNTHSKEAVPSMGSPPVGAPPLTNPPMGMPPMGKHPVGMLPMGNPPVGMPPMAKPPKGMLPMGKPPAGMPLLGKPPAGMPPISYAPDEEAKIYYKSEDFLTKYDNLPENTEYLVMGLCDGSLTCSICHNEIAQAAAIWSCKQCFQPLHLGCIKRWINKVNADGPIEHNPYENTKEEYNEEGRVVSDGNINVFKDSNGNIVMQQTNCYSWTCPNCNYNYTEPMPEYYCFCKKEINPDLSSYYLPHSCSKTCNKAKNQFCLHSSCNIECHPGACIPCEEFVEISCFCGKNSRKVTCHARSQKQNFSCRDICGKTLDCFNHICEEICHEGDCPPCNQTETLTCYCGENQIEVECGKSGSSCGNICGKVLDCGYHTCQKLCHIGDCGECELTPEKIKYCPCGRTSLKNMGLDKRRTSCKDPIPTCRAICSKVLPCGKHHCSKACHEGPCSLCDEHIVDMCRCSKGQRKARCYLINYPIESVITYGEKILSKAKEFRENEFICNKKCSKLKSCKKHRCQKTCCPVNATGHDREGAHVCLENCNKKLSCGEHRCMAFCHGGACEPCAVFSNQPLACPCGKTVLQPPVRCGEKPYCTSKCPKIHKDCGHPCGQLCHPGECFPCTEGVSKICVCGKVTLDNVKCGEKFPNCGHICHKEMQCGHRCTKMCHDHQAFIDSGAIDEGCGQKCNKKRESCNHKCQEKCHGEKECPNEPCDAEIKIYCKCKYRHIIGICNRFIGYDDEFEEPEPLECNSECLKNKRDAQIAKAFTSKDTKKQKELKADYYPEYLIDFAKSNLKLVTKVEKILEEVVKFKCCKTLPDIEGEYLSPIAALVREHYGCDLCRYGSRLKNAKRVTDANYKDEDSRIPSTLLSDYVKLIKDGVISNKANERKEKLFEASIKIPNIPIGMSKEDIKRNLIGFHSEFYTEKIGQKSGYYFHFYNKYRAEEAYKKLRSSAGGFTGVDLIITGEQKKVNKKKKGKNKKAKLDFEGFMEV